MYIVSAITACGGRSSRYDNAGFAVAGRPGGTPAKCGLGRIEIRAAYAGEAPCTSDKSRPRLLKSKPEGDALSPQTQSELSTAYNSTL